MYMYNEWTLGNYCKDTYGDFTGFDYFSGSVPVCEVLRGDGSSEVYPINKGDVNDFVFWFIV